MPTPEDRPIHHESKTSSVDHHTDSNCRGDNFRDATFRITITSSCYSYKTEIARGKQMLCCFMKSWLPFWFDLPFVFIVSSLCLHHPPFRKPLSDSIFLPFLPPFCPPFIHFTSEVCRGISGSVKRFGSIASSFHLRYHPPLFVILVRKSNIVSPIFSCPFLKLYYTLILFPLRNLVRPI